MIPCLCAQTRRAARLLTLLYDAELSKAGLSASQFELLQLLRTGAQNGRGIAAALALDTTTVSRNLKPLLANGLVTASAKPDDTRQRLYELSMRGKAQLKKATPLWAAAQTTMQSRLTGFFPTALDTITAVVDAALAGGPGTQAPR